MVGELLHFDADSLAEPSALPAISARASSDEQLGKAGWVSVRARVPGQPNRRPAELLPEASMAGRNIGAKS